VTRDLLNRVFSERGATVDETGAQGQASDLVIGDAAGITTRGDRDTTTARILLRPLGSTAAMQTGSAWADAPVIELPLRGRDVEAIAKAIVANDLGQLHRQDVSSAALAEHPQFTALKVLAVDDNAVNREVLLEALAGLGVAATMAASGPEAIERVTADRFDVIFMDCSMPEMDGFETTARIRKVEADRGRTPTRVVALTAHVTGPEAQRWRTAGMDGYIAKPFTVAQLATVLETVPDETREVQSAGGGQTLLKEAGPTNDLADIPLLAPATLSMFEMLSKAGKPATAARIFALFKQHAPKGYAELAEAGDDASEQARRTHALKSLCSSAGAARAAAICQRLEEAAKADLPQDEAVLGTLNRVLEETFDAMDQLIPQDALETC
jgi:two-component system sensor histidine kinase BarA